MESLEFDYSCFVMLVVIVLYLMVKIGLVFGGLSFNID